MKARSGMTLVELMVAVALIGIGLLAAINTFTSIQKSIQYSKCRTIATNIAQEKMQIIMQKSYFEVLATTAPAYRVEGSTTVAYDPLWFPPETIVEGGITFTRYTYVQVVQENSGSIEVLPPTTPDTGMRQIVETVFWTTNSGNKFLSTKSVLNNPDTVMSRSILTGMIKSSSTLAGIPGALVVAAENIGWRDNADASGNYTVNLSPGIFNFIASAPGYISNTQLLTMPANGSLAYTFHLIPISSGTIKGSVWSNQHLVISQVVASTDTANGVEYVELYNPTTAPINIGQAGIADINFYIFDKDNNTVPSSGLVPVSLTYVSTYVPVNSYYLIANAPTINTNGTTLTASAYYTSVSAPTHIITTSEAGGLGITDLSGNPMDSISWSKTSSGHSCPTTPLEGNCLPNPSGLQLGEQFIRKTSTAATISSTLGNAYDSGDNSVDFVYNPSIVIPPRTVGATATPVSGAPMPGAIVSVTDGLSVTTTTALTGSPPYAEFTVPNVASGTWIVFIDSVNVSVEIDSVTVSGAATTWIPNSGTFPLWPAANHYATLLTTSGVVGVISGTVLDAAGSPIVGTLSVSAGATSVNIGSNGYYTLRLSTGVYDVVFNPGNGNSSYASSAMTGVTVLLGDMTSNINCNLTKGGKVSGWISRDGTNPLPGVTVIAKDSNDLERDTQVSGTDGRFVLINLTTGTYTIMPILDDKELSSPTMSAVTVTAGNTTWSSTFTVTGAMGTVTGSVTASGTPIKSGVLIIISTSAVSLPPMTLSSSSLTAAAYYSGSSSENGSFSVDVRGSTTTTYYVAGFYMYLNNQTPVISTKSVSNVTVTSGQTTSGVNFAW